MGGFGGWLANLLTGGLLDKILGAWQAHEKAKLERQSEQDRQAFQERMQQRQDVKEIRLATANFWEMRLLTFLIALPFVTHLWLVTFDTLWPQPWNVEAFPNPFNDWEGQILLSFFGIAAVTGVGKAIAGAVAVRRRRGE